MKVIERTLYLVYRRRSSFLFMWLGSIAHHLGLKLDWSEFALDVDDPLFDYLSNGPPSTI